MTIGNIWKTGLTDNMDLEDRKRVMFSNGVYIIAGFILFLQEVVTGGILEVFQSPSFGTLIPFSLIGLAILGLYLNSLKLYLLSRVLFMLSWTFLVSVLPVLYRGPSQTSYFTHSFYIILSSPLIHLLFSHQKERFTLFFFLSISFLLTLFSIDFLLAFDRSAEPKVPLVSSSNLMRITFSVLWVYINLLMAYVLKTNADFYKILQQQKELISSQTALLKTQNEELSTANQELINLNEKIRHLNEALEKRVAERTLELTDRNRLLSDYAFMNAHLLRSPVSRIKGLINLFRLTEDAEEKKQIHEILLQSAEDLDQVVHSISDKLNEGKGNH